jgi:hypothetical protein
VTLADCPYCATKHGDLLLCEPAKRVLDALAARGQRFDMPSIEFPEPIFGANALGDDTVLVRQFVVNAGLVGVAGVMRPVLVFTGSDMDGRPLPRWTYPGTPEEIGRVRDLVAEMAEMAIRRARDAP